MTDGTGNVKDLTLCELKQLRNAGTEQIPTLEEALKLMKDRIIVDIELKQIGELYPGMETIVLDMISKLGMREQVIITSFDHFSIQKVRELDAGIDVGLISCGSSPAFFPFMKSINCRYLSINYPFVTNELIHFCAQDEITLIPWTVDHEADMIRFARQPQLLICTNELDKWMTVSRQKNNTTK